MADVKRRVFTDSDIRALHKELDEVSCPICMDHPHNAVLLLCSSHDKGCRSYICDTSYRHSNCLDRFKRLKENSGDGIPNSSDMNSVMTDDLQGANESHGINGRNASTTAWLHEGPIGNNNEDMQEGIMEERTEDAEIDVENSSESKALKCPMCRGSIIGFEVVDEARNYLNLKKRSCSRESCSFSGSYQELRRHARRVHPTTRPSDVDPSRQRAWRRLENQTEYGDIVSAIRSAMPGAVVVGDYVIENGDRLSMEGDNGRGGGNRPLWSTYYLFQMISSSVDGLPERRPPRSRAWTRHRRSAVGSLPERRFLWGENLLGLQDNRDDEDDLHILSDIGEDESPAPRRRRRDDEDDLHIITDANEDESPVPRRRRRLARSRPDENHP